MSWTCNILAKISEREELRLPPYGTGRKPTEVSECSVILSWTCNILAKISEREELRLPPYGTERKPTEVSEC